MMQGGINNAALFGASQRSARSKLDQMAGIKRPSGILASSPELIQAAMPARPPMPPVMQQSPASMVGAPMVPPAMPAAPMMPNMPMPTTVAPRPLNPMAAGPVVPQPASPNTPMRFKPGGDVDVAPFRPQFQGDVPADAQRLDITMDKSEFDDVLKKLNPESTKYLLETYGDEAGIAQAAQRKVNNISAAAASKDPAQTADQVMVEAGEQPTDAAKIDFAENVFGLEDVNDIDEINRRIANVAIGSSVAKSPDEFAQAVLLGLQTFKQTASARAAAKTGGSGGGYEPMKRYAEALPAMINNIMSSNPGTTIQEAAQQAASVLDPLYGKTAGAGAGAGGEEKRVTMYDPSGKPFYSTDGTNFVDADGNPYVPPATA
jgi:hypothetical protein